MLAFNPVMVIPTILTVLGTSGKANQLLNQLKFDLRLGVGGGLAKSLFNCEDVAYVHIGLDPHVTPFVKVCILEQYKIATAYFAACLQPPKLDIINGLLSLKPTTFVQPSDNAPALTGNVHVFGTGVRSQIKATGKETSVDLNVDIVHDLITPGAALGNINFNLKRTWRWFTTIIGQFCIKI